jgi:hypothetical protein
MLLSSSLERNYAVSCDILTATVMSELVILIDSGISAARPVRGVIPDMLVRG